MPRGSKQVSLIAVNLGRVYMTDRKKKQRALAKAGISHASGWIKDDDQPKFEELVERASGKVNEALKGSE